VSTAREDFLAAPINLATGAIDLHGVIPFDFSTP
jgi:hypothetical protein